MSIRIPGTSRHRSASIGCPPSPRRRAGANLSRDGGLDDRSSSLCRCPPIGYNGLMIRKAIIILLTLAAVATGVLWVVSLSRGTRRSWSWDVQHYYAEGSGTDRPPSRSTRFLWYDGGVRLWVYRGCLEVAQTHHVDPAATVEDRDVRFGEFSVKRTLWGSGCNRYGLSTTRVRRALRVPLWALFIALSGYPTIALVCGPLRRWRRRRHALCLKCGYDLTGNISGTCPECGSKVEQR